MRISKIRRKLAENQPILCTKMNTLDPVVADLIGWLGFDCLWLCNEHTGIDWDRMGHLVKAASYHNMDTVIRVAKGAYTDFIRPLELGATGVMVPHCMSAEEAREVGRMTKFQPQGRRALDSGNADGAYCMVPLAKYLEHANANTFTIVQIEDPEALDQVEEIVAAPGVDLVFVGPADLSHGLGVPGQMRDPRIVKCLEDVAAACKKHGKHWGTPSSPENAPRLLEMGARFLACGADVLGMSAYFRDIRSKFEGFGCTFENRLP
ncbi:MAG: aldolase [Acidobacteria bacterium]|nr:aldolase [Acidobacteriota bacterium]